MQIYPGRDGGGRYEQRGKKKRERRRGRVRGAEEIKGRGGELRGLREGRGPLGSGLDFTDCCPTE